MKDKKPSFRKPFKPSSPYAAKPIKFFEQNKDELTELLGKVLNVSEIGYEFKDDTLILKGLLDSEEAITFTHPNSAKAFLDGYLLGYDHGFGDGRK